MMYRNMAWLALVVAVLFCLTHGGSADGLTIEAPAARVKTAGGSQRGLWNLWSEGELGDYVRFARAGTYTVTVRAHGSKARGVWSIMALCLDGEIVEQRSVNSRSLEEYAFPIEVKAGVYRLTVAFLNDFYRPGEDRNLYVAEIRVVAPQGMPEPVLAGAAEWEERWGKEMAEREEQVLKKATESIEANRKGQATVQVLDAQGRPVQDASVSAEQLRHDFLFGCNIYMFDRFKTAQENELYKRRFRELFNYATTGFYWRGYEYEQGKPNYAYTDKVVAWCTQHHIRLKGHPLLWDAESGQPVWAGGQPAPEIRKKRVYDILRRYSGKIEFWEVVNEPAHLPGLKIDEPYRWARDADPNAYLIVNDYYVMANGYPPFFDLLQEAIRSGVPFDGIGIQAHEPRTMRFPLDRVWRMLDRYATLGKDLHITEFTPTSAGQPITGSHVKGVWDEAAQAEYAEKFYRVCFAHPAVVAITWWDLCDRGSWLKGGGMLHEDLSPKPVYTALNNLIHEEWHTRAEGKTDQAGSFSFRGFYGDYRVQVQVGGKTSTAEFHLGKGAENILIVEPQ